MRFTEDAGNMFLELWLNYTGLLGIMSETTELFTFRKS
jgi:hypothetical protein